MYFRFAEEFHVIQRRIVLSLLAVVAAALPVRSQEADLTWKFKKDAIFYQEMTTETTQEMKVQGTEVKQTQKQTFYFKWTPTEIDAMKKEVTLQQEIIGLKMAIDIGGSKIDYNSTEAGAGGGTTNPLNKFFEALKDAKFKITLNTEKMQVTGISGHEEFVTKLGNANPQMKPLLEKILSKKALQDMAEPMFAAMPGGKQTKGKSWERKSELDMGPIGKYNTTYTYTYDGQDAKKNEIVKIKTDLKYEAPKAEAMGGLPFRIKSAELKGSDGTGTVVIDPKLGWVASQDMSLTLKGKLTIEIGQQSTEVDLDQKQTTSIKTSEKNPVPEKKTP